MQMDLTSALALWGAVIATAALTWNIVRDIGERPKVKIDAMIGRMYPDHADRSYVILTMTNIGRRPVFIKGWGATLKKDGPQPKGLVVRPHGLPKMLSESEYHIEFTHDFRVLAPEVERLYVYDSSGREWKLTRKQLRELRKQAHDELTKLDDTAFYEPGFVKSPDR
jgi:hypothetical protein